MSHERVMSDIQSCDDSRTSNVSHTIVLCLTHDSRVSYKYVTSPKMRDSLKNEPPPEVHQNRQKKNWILWYLALQIQIGYVTPMSHKMCGVPYD